MISSKIIEQAKDLALIEAEKYEVPSTFQIDLSVRVGKRLAVQLNADKGVVEVGCWLMDCMLGRAYKERKTPDHVRMSEVYARKFLSDFVEVDSEEIENICRCISEHHGGVKFYSIESEICCNADCYRFASVEGVVGGILNSRKMSVEEIVKLYLEKADEKWNALSLEICKKEIKSEYLAIKNFLKRYKQV